LKGPYVAICKQCGGRVEWKKQNDRWICENQDGSDHWDLCSARRWQQVKATGVRFDHELESGYAGSIHGTKFERKSSGWRRGENFKLSGLCQNCVPPWEDCPNGCPDAFAA
jgi:hypothetical protein